MIGLRVYEVDELRADGYPAEWHDLAGGPLDDGWPHYAPGLGIKDVVREAVGNRCVRCHHPYVKGAGEWSPCDSQCDHPGPRRVAFPDDDPLVEEPGAPSADALTFVAIATAYPTGQVQAQYRILTVHHLDGVKANCRWWNLAALCQRCHLTIQGRVRMERVWPWEHTDWFKPYVAGFYAWSYLGEDLERDEVDARRDDLLGLERVA